MDKRIIRNVLEALYSVRECVPERAYGLCGNLELAKPTDPSEEVARDEWLKDGFRSWPHFSGDRHYPVPHPLGAVSGFTRTPDLWDGSYGELRKDLMRFLIQRAERQLSEE